MKFESLFNKIKRPIVLAGALTMASLLPLESKGQEATLDLAPKKEIINGEGEESKKKLEVVRQKLESDIAVQVASLQAEVNLLSDEVKYKKNMEDLVVMDKSNALNQISLIGELKSGMDSVNFYQSRVNEFLQNYSDLSLLLSRTGDKNLKKFYKDFEKLLKGAFLFSYRKFELETEMRNLESKDYTGKSVEFENDFKALLDKYEESLKRQFINPFDTKEKLENYLENVWTGRVPIEPKKESLDGFKKMQETLKEKRTLEFIKDTILVMYKQAYEHINSEAYLKKLIVEFGNEPEAVEHQKYRINKLKEAQIEFEFEKQGFSRYYPGENKIVYNIRGILGNPSLDSGPHELGHLIDQAGTELSDTAKVLYENAWVGDAEFLKLRKAHPFLFETPNWSAEQDLNYFKGATELNARKQVLEIFMEKSGIKKYGEQMTEKHYEKLMELFKKGELDRDCSQVLLLTKKEFLIEILNTVAYEADEDVLYLV